MEIRYSLKVYDNYILVDINEINEMDIPLVIEFYFYIIKTFFLKAKPFPCQTWIENSICFLFNYDFILLNDLLSISTKTNTLPNMYVCIRSSPVNCCEYY